MDRRLTQRGRERRRQLMDFAASRFAEHGYHPTSVAEIVQGLGVGKGVFYWYFSSKEELFGEILREAQQDLRRAQSQAIADCDDPVDRIDRGIHASIAWFATHRDEYTLFQFAASEERFAPAVRKGQQVAVRDARRQVQEAIDRGLVRDLDTDLISHAILGVTTQLVRVFIHEQDQDPDDIAAAASSMVLDGILSTPRAAPS